MGSSTKACLIKDHICYMNYSAAGRVPYTPKLGSVANIAEIQPVTRLKINLLSLLNRNIHIRTTSQAFLSVEVEVWSYARPGMELSLLELMLDCYYGDRLRC